MFKIQNDVWNRFSTCDIILIIMLNIQNDVWNRFSDWDSILIMMIFKIQNVV